MSTARDQFADDIYEADRLHKNDPPSLVTHYSYVIADELIAAGYRKPRTITTAEELDALPYESVIKASDGNVWESLVDGWFETASRAGSESSSIPLPATVLYEPEPQP